MKLIELAVFEDAEIGTRARRLWLNETRLSGKLRHPHIVEAWCRYCRYSEAGEVQRR